jgi:hypothetical protein
MQIQNFYSDWLPASSSPLDSIVLSPHTMNTRDCNISTIKEDYCDSPSLLCPQDPNQFSPFASSQKQSGCTCQLKKCFIWFRKRCSSRRE